MDPTGPSRIQPVTIVYRQFRGGLAIGRALRACYAWYGDMALLPHLWAALGLPGVRVELRFHKPLPAAAFASRKALAAHAERQVASGLDWRRASAPRPEPALQPLVAAAIAPCYIARRFRLAGRAACDSADQVVIVTGGAHGIGRACADGLRRRRCGGRGRRHRCRRPAPKRRRRSRRRAAGARFIQTDVGDIGQAQRLVEQTLEAFGRLDVLINNAGIIKTADFLEISEADFDAVLRVNLKGVFLVGQAAARAMVEQGRGAIVNMSSTNAVVAIANQVPYATSKGAVNQLTKVMALALADKGVRVNAIGPGSILTDLLQGGDERRRGAPRILSRTPLGRCGEPEEIARVALFLASDEASYITGQTIYPDGGRLALNYTVPVPDA